ncbi:hypothetical protein QUB75_00210 [Microcoleus sp. K1-B6]|uniref:hypothetical protein n=1 Tax=unclassified Microcoleus TaxID=2642155 RepID=UPI002FD1C269
MSVERAKKTLYFSSPLGTFDQLMQTVIAQPALTAQARITQGKRIMSTSGNFTVLVATIIDSCSLLKRYLTADSGGYSSQHYYYSPGNLDAFAL